MYIIMEVEKNNLKVTLFFFKMTLGKGRFWENELFQVYIIFTEIKERWSQIKKALKVEI